MAAGKRRNAEDEIAAGLEDTNEKVISATVVDVRHDKVSGCRNARRHKLLTVR